MKTHIILLVACSASLLLLQNCNTKNTSSGSEKSAGIAENSTATVSADDIEFEWIQDPAEKAFEVQLPRGWKNDAYIYRVYDLTRNVATSLSPDGNTALFIGDPKMPAYSIPNDLSNQYGSIANQNPLFRYEEYKKADEYLENYVKNKFGKLTNFNITKKTTCPEYIKLIEDQFQENGMKADEITTSRIFFDYDMNGKKVHALLNCTVTLFNTIWMPGVNGISTTGNPASFNEMVFKIVSTVKHNPDWLANEERMRQQRLAKMQADHQRNMAEIHASGQRHQLRMQNMQAANDAHNNSWKQQQNSIDNNHGMFLNMIKEESTVATPTGQTFQVDNSHQKYYINKLDNSYIGTDQYTTKDDLRKLNPNIDPDNYEEAQILR